MNPEKTNQEKVKAKGRNKAIEDWVDICRYQMYFSVSDSPHIIVDMFQKYFLDVHFEMLSTDELDKIKFEITSPENLKRDFK